MAGFRQDKHKKIYLLSGKRTPFGKFGGSLKSKSPVDLAVIAGKACMDELNLRPDLINQVIMGNVIPSTTDTLYAGRHVALKLGMPIETPGYVLNRLCGSGIQVIGDAARSIAIGEADCLLVGGVENMSMAPHLVYGSRFGTKYGSLQTVDLLLDALSDKYAEIPMGMTAENLAEKFSLSREECDEFALNSHKKASAAYEKGKMQGELVAVEHRKGVCEKDEHLRSDASLEQMTKLKASFKKNGTVTPGSASGIVDGAACAIIASGDFCEKHGLNPLAEIIDVSVVGVDPKIMGIGPVPAIKNILEKNKLSLDEIDLLEINEAFAPQTLACVKDLDLQLEKLNIWGGAISLGHPLAASGTRLTTTLARQLKDEKLKTGIASACIGGGQGIAMLIRSCKE